MPKICIAGKNDIAVNALEYLIKDCRIGVDDILVVPNRNDDGNDGWQKSLLKAARVYGVKVYDLKDVYGIRDLIFFSLEFDRIIKTSLFSTQSLYNIHFSKLPKYRGMFTSVMPILNGESETGVTLHKIDDGIDTGAIISQRTIKIDINDTARDLYFKFLNEGLSLFKGMFANIVNGSFTAVPQPVAPASYYSKFAIDFKNINIDFRKTSFEIHNQLRAFMFKEYQLPVVAGRRVRKSVLTNEVIDRMSFQETADGFVVSGIDGFKVLLFKDADVSR